MTPSDAAVRLCIAHGVPANLCEEVLNTFGRSEPFAEAWLRLTITQGDPGLPTARERLLVVGDEVEASMPSLQAAIAKAEIEISKVIRGQSLVVSPPSSMAGAALAHREMVLGVFGAAYAHTEIDHVAAAKARAELDAATVRLLPFWGPITGSAPSRTRPLAERKERRRKRKQRRNR